MGQPNWSKIPFEKMPEWKKQEILATAKKTVEAIEPTTNQCPECGKVCKSKLGLSAHLRSHKK